MKVSRSFKAIPRRAFFLSIHDKAFILSVTEIRTMNSHGIPQTTIGIIIDSSFDIGDYDALLMSGRECAQ